MTLPTGTEARVCADIAERQAKGIAKYGTTVEGNPLTLRQWLQHAYEETLDKAVYLKRAMEEMDKSTNPAIKRYASGICDGSPFYIEVSNKESLSSLKRHFKKTVGHDRITNVKWIRR